MRKTNVAGLRGLLLDLGGNVLAVLGILSFDSRPIVICLGVGVIVWTLIHHLWIQVGNTDGQLVDIIGNVAYFLIVAIVCHSVGVIFIGLVQLLWNLMHWASAAYANQT